MSVQLPPVCNPVYCGSKVYISMGIMVSIRVSIRYTRVSFRITTSVCIEVTKVYIPTVSCQCFFFFVST